MHFALFIKKEGHFSKQNKNYTIYYWWWIGRPGVLQSMVSQRVGHDWATEVNWVSTHHRHQDISLVSQIQLDQNQSLFSLPELVFLVDSPSQNTASSSVVPFSSHLQSFPARKCQGRHCLDTNAGLEHTGDIWAGMPAGVEKILGAVGWEAPWVKRSLRTQLCSPLRIKLR